MKDKKSKGAARPSSVVFLRELLRTGAKSARDVAVLSLTAGYAWRTMQDASVRLKVQRSKAGMMGGWTWTLPLEFGEGAATICAFGASNPDLAALAGPGCLAAYGFEAPLDGLLYSRPHLD